MSEWTYVLNGVRCPDGVVPADGGGVRYRSDRRESYRLNACGGKVLLEFLNAVSAGSGTQEKLERWFSRYGLVGSDLSRTRLTQGEVSDAANFAGILGEKAISACQPGGGDFVPDGVLDHCQVDVAVGYDTDGSPRLEMVAADMFDFWQLEAMSLMMAGTPIETCRHCDGLFLARRSATTCTPKCRVAQWRADNPAANERTV